MSMISDALITGGVFNQSVQVNQRQVYTQKSAIDRLQEAVAHTAFHNSGERFDPPKCHPNTRIAVRDKIEKWARRTDPDTKHASILWLSGAAGAGKSAIAQTVAEDFHSRGLLIASFFFGRSDSTRNHARSLVSTIVYQLYSFLPPPEQSQILAVIDRDPLIFTKTLLAQFEALIVIPLQPLFDNGFWSSTSTPRLIIIDGLDECLEREMQRNVLLMLSASLRQFHIPFIFLLASRPEHDIQAMFNSPDFWPIHSRLFLDDTYLPDRDIELFLRDQFQECRTTHPFRHLIPPDWPSDNIVNKLTTKSSGQFIYASVVAKYVKSSRHRPDHRLDVVLNLRPSTRDLPFSELDALYTHIFSGVDDIERVLNIISFHITSTAVTPRIVDIEDILQLDAGEVAILLCDLFSVIGYEHQPNSQNSISIIGYEHQSVSQMHLKIYHASLVDYLLDNSRSKAYFVDLVKRCPGHVADCFQLLSYIERRVAFGIAAVAAMSYFVQYHTSLELTGPLYHAIKGFSISHIYELPLDSKEDITLLWFDSFTYSFLPALFGFLNKLDSAKHLELHQYHQSGYDLFLRESMAKYSSTSPMHLLFALVAIHHNIPRADLHYRIGLLDASNFDGKDLDIFHIAKADFADGGYSAYLSSFLWDPKRSREFCAGPHLFALAAEYCLLSLCNHTAPGQRAPPQMSAEQRMRRTHTPWKWHHRVLREDFRGPRDTLWLRCSTSSSTSDSSVLRARVLLRNTNKAIYIRKPSSLPPWYDSDTVTMYRGNSERYHFVLTYLNYFLPKAGKLDSLVDMCQRLRLASLSQEFPRKSARALSNMQKYVAQSA